MAAVIQTFTSENPWTLEHPWDFNPEAVVVDGDGNEILVAPDYSVPGEVTIHWLSDSSGTLTLIGGTALEEEFTAIDTWTMEYEWSSVPLVVVVDSDGNDRWVEPDFSVPGYVTVYWLENTSGTMTLIDTSLVEDSPEGVGVLPTDTRGRRIDRGWKIVLYESNLYDNDTHPITGLPTPGIHTLVRVLKKASNKSYSPILNRPGSVRFRLPLDHSEALDVVGYEIKRCVVIFINAEDLDDPPVPVWSGYISSCDLSASSGSVEVTCTGWLQMLYGREFRQAHEFDAIEATIIGQRLLGTANNQIANGNENAGVLQENLLGDAGDFEDDLSWLAASDTGKFRNELWTTFGDHPARSGDWDYDSPIMPSGATGLFQGIRYNDGGATANSLLVGQDKFTGIVAGTTYRLKTNVDLKRCTNSGCKARITMLFYTSGDSPLTSPAPVEITGTLGVREVTGTFLAPATAAKARIKLETITTAPSDEIAIIWDSMVITKENVDIDWVGLRPLPILMGERDDTNFERTRNYQVGDKIGNALEELSNIESGFDMEVKTVEEEIDGGKTFTRRLNLKFETVKGTIKGIGEDRTNVVFGYRWGGASNLADVGESRDGTNMATRMNARSPGKNPALAQDIAAIDDRGLWEDSAIISDDVGSDVLLGYAGAEVAFRAAPTRRFKPTPRPYDGSVITPAVFRDYNVGDVVYMVAQRGAMQIGTEARQPIRIFAFTVSIDEEGNEKISEFQTTVGGS